MAKKAFDEKLARLEALRGDASAPDAVQTIRKYLREQGFLAGKAASLAARAGSKELIPDLLAAFDRLFVHPGKSDPQCWGKTAIAKALKDLEFTESAAFLRGAVHVQMEPVWGGQEDTAGPLRSACLLALVACRDLPDLQLLTHLTDALADSKKTVRMDAARAIGQVGREEGALLLRLKAMAGDREQEVTGACLAVLLDMRVHDAVCFAARFLKSADPDVRLEAAGALGESRDPEAFAVLKQAWEQERSRDFRDNLLAAIGMSRQEEAMEFLLSLIGRAGADQSETALRAMAPSRFSEEIRKRVADAVERTGDDHLLRVFQEFFRT